MARRERIKKKIYRTREEARRDIFDYIEMFYNSKRRHGSSDQISPTEYANQYYQRPGSVWIIRGDSPTDGCSINLMLNDSMDFTKHQVSTKNRKVRSIDVSRVFAHGN